MHRQNPLTPHAAIVIAWLRAALDRRRGDAGATTLETIIIAVGFAVAAGVLVAAVTGKLHTWIAQIPG